MNRNQVINYLELLDGKLSKPASLYIYGSAALILLGEPERTSIDIDIAGSYSEVDQNDLRRAAAEIGSRV